MKTNPVTLFGFGRFGKLFYSLLSPHLSVVVHDPYVDPSEHPEVSFVSLEEALHSSTLIYAVPIPAFRETIENHCRELKDTKLLIDLLSVKLLPKEVFAEYVDSPHEVLLTHPMFGPDSVKKAGIEGQRIVIDSSGASDEAAAHWKALFADIGLSVIEMSADEHDRLAARSQGLTHFIGRTLDALGMKPTPIDTLGAQTLCSLKEQTCNDSWELFSGLQTENPYTVEMRLDLGRALQEVYGRLLPTQRYSDRILIGIQGGQGSFNEEAAHSYVERHNINDYKLVYLHTSKRVLDALHRGEVDFGQFAVHNSTGGIVQESLLAMSEHSFSIEEQFSIPIEHTLMKRPDVPIEEITAVMSHPQVFKQCRETLKTKYPQLELLSGEGNLIDSAGAARGIAEGKLPAHYAAMGSKVIAEIYNLEIIEEGLQDLEGNVTSFIMVKRITP